MEPQGSGVLITRPEPGAAEIARGVAALGWEPVLAPALELAPRPLGPLPQTQAILLTSRAAARALPSSGTPVLAVGEATAAEARARGFADVSAAPGGDAASLAAHVAATRDPAGGPLLLAVGQGYGAELAAALRRRGFRVLRRVAYAARPAMALPAPAQRALRDGTVSVALFYSPRSAACAMRLLHDAGLAATAQRIVALAISSRVAATLSGGGAGADCLPPLAWHRVRVAPRPDGNSLLELLGRAAPNHC